MDHDATIAVFEALRRLRAGASPAETVAFLTARFELPRDVALEAAREAVELQEALDGR
jgi:hypothetical protein